MIYLYIALYITGVVVTYLYSKKQIRGNKPPEDWLDVFLFFFISLLSWFPFIVWKLADLQEKYNIKIKPPKWF